VLLHNEIVDFVSLIEPQPKEIDERELMVEKFKILAEDTFGGPEKCRVVVFGSQATGLFLPTSDIDIVIYTPDENKHDNEKETGCKDRDMENNEKVKRLQATLEKEKELDEMDRWDINGEGLSPLQRLAKALEQEWKEKLSYLEVIENTRIPLVKFTYLSLNIDVCFNQPGGPEAAQLMKEYLDSMPPLRPLIFVLKYYLSCRALNEPYRGGVGSFMLQLMIVSFLQNRAREDFNSGRMMENDYDSNSKCLGSILLGFFELYGLDFNYITTGISVRDHGSYFSKVSYEAIGEYSGLKRFVIFI